MKDRRYLTFPQLFALLLLGGGLYFFLGSNGLHLWAQGRKHPGARAILTAAIEPVKELTDGAGISAPLAAVKARFHALKETPFNLTAFQGATPKAATPGPRRDAVSSPGSAGEIPVSGGPAPPAEADPAPVSSEFYATSAPEESAAGTGDPAFHEEKETGPSETMVSREEEGAVSSPYRILLMGDSLANSTATALVPLAEQVPEIILTNHGKVSSNLSNPVFTDWFAEVDSILEAQQFHTVLLMLGANAAQSISVENREVLYDTPEWNRIYRERAARLIAKLKTHTDRVFWVGIPPMLNRGYRERMERQNQIIHEICVDQGINYLPIDMVMGDHNGKYTDYKTVEGRQIKLRLSDNVHYTAAGAELLSRHLINIIYPDITLPESP